MSFLWYSFLIIMPHIKRPPIVVVVGHVNHGKTSLLDYIRKTGIAAGEAGGITQSIGAYEITHKGEKISFIDTPGHEAFIGMRARGAKIADLAILVVAADDGVQAQTKEAIRILKETQTPFVVAITKIDKGVNLDTVKNELMQAEVLLEGYGGKVSWQGVSAKTGEGIHDLLDLVLLTAEVEHREYDPAHPAQGFIIEAKKDAQRGIVAHAIVTDGTLSPGDDIRAGGMSAHIRSLEDAMGMRLQNAVPAAPVVIVGFKNMPPVGAAFVVGAGYSASGVQYPESRVQSPASSIQSPVSRVQRLVVKEGEIVVNVIIKAETGGALEALAQVVQGIPLPVGYVVRVVDQGVGEITDGDVQWLTATEAKKGILVGFNVSATKTAEAVARINGITILTSSIIYDLARDLAEVVKGAGNEAIVGDVEVLAVFGKKEGRQIVGGKVVAGEIKNQSACGIERGGAVVGVGRMVNVQQNKADAAVVPAGNECGLLIQTNAEIKVGDRLVIK